MKRYKSIHKPRSMRGMKKKGRRRGFTPNVVISRKTRY